MKSYAQISWIFKHAECWIFVGIRWPPKTTQPTGISRTLFKSAMFWMNSLPLQEYEYKWHIFVHFYEAIVLYQMQHKQFSTEVLFTLFPSFMKYSLLIYGNPQPMHSHMQMQSHSTPWRLICDSALRMTYSLKDQTQTTRVFAHINYKEKPFVSSHILNIMRTLNMSQSFAFVKTKDIVNVQC